MKRILVILLLLTACTSTPDAPVYSSELEQVTEYFTLRLPDGRTLECVGALGYAFDCNWPTP